MATSDEINKINNEISALARKLGKGPFKVFEPNELNEAKSALNGLKSELADMEGSATNLYERLRGVTSELKGQETATQGIRKAFRSLTAIATKLRNDELEIEELGTKQLENLKQQLKVASDKLKDDQERLIAENDIAKAIKQSVEDFKEIGADQDIINELVSDQLKTTLDLTEEQKSMIANYFDENRLADKLLKKTEDRLKVEKEIDRKVKGFTALKDLTKSIPGLRAFAEPFEKAEQAARKAAKSGENFIAAGSKELAASGGKAIQAGFFKTLLKGLKEGQDNITQFSRQLNITRQESDKLNDSLQRTGRATVGIIGNELVKANLDLSNALGATAQITGENAVAFATMTKQLGMTSEQASNLARFSATTGESVDEITDRITGTVIAQNAAGDSAIRYQDVLKDVADASAATQLTVSKFPGGLAQAAFEARKFGLSLSQLEKSGEGLLNFESSIAAELEAELLTGKQLNLERARMAALTGDTATLSRELARNFGTAEEFSKMNVIQQNALAKSMGMTRQELAKTLQQEAALDKFKVKTNEELKKKVQAEEEAIRKLEKQGKFEDARVARQKLYAKLGDEELGRQRQNESVQESIASSLASIASLAQSLSIFLDPIVSAFQSISEAGAGAFGFFGKLGSKVKALGFVLKDSLKPMRLLVNVPRDAIKFFGRFGKFLGGPFLKAAGKGGIKSLLKKIPVIGAIVGAGMAIKRFKEGDILGGIMEAASGIASIFPGIGTGISLGIDAALLGTDMAGVTGEKSKTVQGSIGAVAATTGLGTMGGGGFLQLIAMNNLQKVVEKSAKASEEAAQAMKDKKLEVNMDSRKMHDGLQMGDSKFR